MSGKADAAAGARRPKVITFYLPQFHPILENDSWWGAGFTEWFNVAKARPLFKGHQQPNLPGELGFYDLRLAETRRDQAALASTHGIHGFCYWHYWFAGERLLERPLEEVLSSADPDFPFCVGWANESWTGIWHGAPGKLLKEQTYPEGDADAHYTLLRRFFHDPRYIRDAGRPLLYVYRPRQLPQTYLRRLRELARQDGFPGLFIVGTWGPNPGARFDTLDLLDLDAAVITHFTGRDALSKAHIVEAVRNRLLGRIGGQSGPRRVSFDEAAGAMTPAFDRFPFAAYHAVTSNWDNTPRSGRRGLVLTDGHPAKLERVLRAAVQALAGRKNRVSSEDWIFLKSWNEWAEGNYVEPDQRYGREWLRAVARATGTPIGND